MKRTNSTLFVSLHFVLTQCYAHLKLPSTTTRKQSLCPTLKPSQENPAAHPMGSAQNVNEHRSDCHQHFEQHFLNCCRL